MSEQWIVFLGIAAIAISFGMLWSGVRAFSQANDILDRASALIDTEGEYQAEALDRLDLALCQFLNNVGDEYDPRVWLPSVKRDLDRLSKVYNECHVIGLMDLKRAARSLIKGKGEGE